MQFQAMSWEQIRDAQLSPQQRAFRDFRAKFEHNLTSNDPKIAKARDNWIKTVQAIGPREVHTDRALTNFAVQYVNEEYIGDSLSSAPIPAASKSDEYYVFNERNRLGFPDDRLGDRDYPNQVTQNYSSDSFLCQDRGLEHPVSEATILNQDAVLDVLRSATEIVSEGIAFNREVRWASLFGTSANYGANTASLAALPWSNPASDPARDVLTARGQLWSGAGAGIWKGFMSYDVYKNLATHPGLISKFAGSGRVDKSGLVTPQMLADIFDLAEIHIGRAWKDTANEGQTASYSRIWPDVFGIVRVARSASKYNAVFASRFQWLKQRVTITNDQRAGVRGTHFVGSTLSDVEKVIAAKTGYLLTSVI
jgi:hypothetical protein